MPEFAQLLSGPPVSGSAQGGAVPIGEMPGTLAQRSGSRRAPARGAPRQRLGPGCGPALSSPRYRTASSADTGPVPLMRNRTIGCLCEPRIEGDLVTGLAALRATGA